MALAHCILGKFLGVSCHCSPPPLDVPTFSASCLHVQRRERPLAAAVFVGEKCSEKFRLEFDLHVILEIFYMPQICDMGQTALLPLRRKACWGFFSNTYKPSEITVHWRHHSGQQLQLFQFQQVFTRSCRSAATLSRIVWGSRSTRIYHKFTYHHRDNSYRTKQLRPFSGICVIHWKL